MLRWNSILVHISKDFCYKVSYIAIVGCNDVSNLSQGLYTYVVWLKEIFTAKVLQECMIRD